MKHFLHTFVAIVSTHLDKSYLSLGKWKEVSLFQFVLGKCTRAIWASTDLIPALCIVLVPHQESER